ncbi:hypothetical protein SAMN05880501_11634 [Ureibacillus xyleni]|uniref:Uncharacterized protein n=1 Tax=Ureibacillus xyleni TaxID=614648 RepID=A0A285TMD7_9BACL|nr:hypothetical protein [Ureibacillus xyleni]SOC23893.1 hypothetical protein SAMN05880501_11634 [Ureibacillus xyleni]
MKYLLTIFSLILLIGCTQEIVDSPPTDPVNKEEAKTDFKHFFKPDGTTSTFLGEGNEYASYTEKTKWLSDNYVATVIDNGGATTMKVYRVLEDRIDLVYDELVEEMPNDVVYPEVQSLDKLEAVEPYLASPIEVGTTFGNWKIVETGASIDTHFETFENAIVIEEQGEDFTNRKYVVEGFGVVKSESVMVTDTNEEYIVTSTLERIE